MSLADLAAGLLIGTTRLLCGPQARWVGCEPSTRQRIYFANHCSHLDAVALWSCLPAPVRRLTRPVAALDYWGGGGLKGFLAREVFRSILVDRSGADPRAVVDHLAESMGQADSIILFPEGTRGTGEELAPFKSGLYHLSRKRPDVDLVPVSMQNLNRILPKGEILPVPLFSSVSFGAPLRAEESESKTEFLQRAREALLRLVEP